MILTIKIPTKSISLFKNSLSTQRTSPCASCQKKRQKRKYFHGSITIEASFAVPIFFFAMLIFFYMLEVMAIRTNIRSGMQYAGKMVSEKAYLVPAVTPGQLERDITDAIGEERLERSIVENGKNGIHCEESRMSPMTAELNLKVSYRVVLPIPVFGGVSVPMKEEMRFKG